MVVEQLDGLLAQPLDIHRLAADEVDDAPENLGTAAAGIGAVVLRLALVAHQRRMAYGALGDVCEGTAVGRPFGVFDARDFRNDFAPLLDIDHVARADVQQGHLFGVVERCAADGGAGQQHRFEVGHRRDGSRPAHLEVDAHKPREGLLGLELVGDGPLRSLGREAQLAAQGEVVDLDDHAVGGEGQLAPRRVPMVDEVVDLGPRAADAHRIRDLEAPRARLLKAFPVVREGKVVARKLVERAVQPAARHHRRGLLLERAGRRVARIGQQRFARRLAFGVEPVERDVGHEHFAADFEQLGPPLALQPQRYGADGADVGRHVVALDAVAARRGQHQLPVFVGERDGRAVELQFADQLGLAHLLFDAVDEFVQFVKRVGVAQREHRKTVADAPEFRREVAAHADRGRIGVGILGILPFEVDELAHHRVEFEVGDFGSVFDVVFVVVAVELQAELGDSCLGCHLCRSFVARASAQEPCGGVASACKRPLAASEAALNICIVA